MLTAVVGLVGGLLRLFIKDRLMTWCAAYVVIVGLSSYGRGALDDVSTLVAVGIGALIWFFDEGWVNKRRGKKPEGEANSKD